MKAGAVTMVMLLCVHLTNAQIFRCDGKAYVISYTQSVGVSTLYEVSLEDENIDYKPIPLSEDRRLTSLAYHVLDQYLYALDVDTYELIKISSDGTLSSLGVPRDIDKSYKFHSGTIAADGSVLTMVGYSEEFDFDNRFYSINMGRADLYAGYLGVTGDTRVEVHDMATDPTNGTMYGYDNKNGRLVEVAIGGQINSVNYPTTGVTDMDGLFFNITGELYGYSANRGFYNIDKLTGVIDYKRSGPEGTHADACSCPYTYEFEKTIAPKAILPCEEFTVIYKFNNQLGIPQTWVKLRDTFPDGFEILDITGDIVTADNIIVSDPHILALDNLIYLMRDNEIKVRVRASTDFIGEFSSSGVHWDFPQAFGEYQYTDDPYTDDFGDPTSAALVSSSDIDFNDYISYSCDGKSVIIESPIEADRYLWSNGITAKEIIVDKEGIYYLEAFGDCVTYEDSVVITEFRENKEVFLEGATEVTLGNELIVTPKLNRGSLASTTWIFNGQELDCQECLNLSFRPTMSGLLEVEVVDDEGCVTMGSIEIRVSEKRNLYGANAFSPNGDGVNDVFYLQSSLPGTVVNMEILNRWGNVIYTAEDAPLNDEPSGWDGSMLGHELESGVYVWTALIRYFDGTEERYSGALTLLRM